MGWGGGIGSAWLGILLMVFEKNLPPIKKRLIWAKEFYPGQFHSHFSSAQNQQNPHRRLTVSRPTRRIRGPRLTAVNLCRLFGRTEPRAAEQDCRRQLGKSRFAPVRNVTRWEQDSRLSVGWG